MNKLKFFVTSIIALIIAALITACVLLIYYDRTPWTYAVIAICIILIDAIFAIYIISSRRHIYTKACWLVAIVVLPLGGCLFFLIFGTFPMNRKDWKEAILSENKFNKFEDYTYSKQFTKVNNDTTNLFKFSYKNELKPIYEKNNVRSLLSNTDSYEEVIKLIRNAKKFIHLKTYILKDSVFFRSIVNELIKKSREGVKIRVLIDWYGSLNKVRKHQIERLKEENIEVGIFNPSGINPFKSSTNYRLHRKVLIVDNKYAFYGGSNISDEYLSLDPKKYYWRDQNFVFEGEIVNSLNIVFVNDWITFTDYSITDEQRDVLMSDLKKYLRIHHAKNKMNMQVCTNSPNVDEKGAMNLMATMILRAKKSIKLVTPYFLPTELCMSALKIAGRSGINIQILLPGKPDNKKFILAMNRSHYQELLDIWCKVYEYDGFIHSKYLIIDDRYVFITSSNFDFRSFWSNFEDGILIESKKFTREIKNTFINETKNAELITRQKNKQFNTFINRLKIKFMNLYKPLL